VVEYQLGTGVEEVLSFFCDQGFGVSAAVDLLRVRFVLACRLATWSRNYRRLMAMATAAIAHIPLLAVYFFLHEPRKALHVTGVLPDVGSCRIH
jgi:hypothetical protein